jgi:hypothetical protein
MNTKKKAVANAASEGADGIFGKAAKKLFRLPDVDGKKVDFIPPAKNVKDAAKKYKLPKKNKGNKDQPRPHVQSKKIDPGSSDLAKATQEARRREGDDGAKNYAAYRYIDKNGEERILVGRSEGTHSERSAGSFLLDEMKNGNVKSVTEVYTERAPCAPPKGHCAQWLHANFQQVNPDFAVSHSWNYDGTDGTNDQVSDNIRKYAANLLK